MCTCIVGAVLYVEGLIMLFIKGCVSVCCMCMYVCVRLCLYVHASAYLVASVCVCMYVDSCVVCMCVCACISCVCVCLCCVGCFYVLCCVVLCCDCSVCVM